MELCVKTVKYMVCVNGSLVVPIYPSRGLRQGDPLSPYLFLLCVEGLSYSLNLSALNDELHGCYISASAPEVTHLLFADDSFLFFKANKEESQRVKNILEEYEMQSGQAVNFNKSGIFFSSNVRRDKQAEISDILGVHNELKDSSYLGLPSLIGRSRKKVFSFVKERVWKRIQGWTNSNLSKAGKAGMIRNVAQTIPSYCMSCFLIPKSLSQEIERIMNDYWWKSGSTGCKGIRWLAWDKMCSSKDSGGLGFRSLYGFNLALLEKHVWNFLHKPDFLVARIFKARYYPNNHVLQAQRGQDASFIWSGICEARDELSKGYRWILGDGASINVFSDQWLKGKVTLHVEEQYVSSNRFDKVKEYIRPDIKQWDEAKVHRPFHEVDVNSKSGYDYWYGRHFEQESETEASGWKRLWKLPIPHKMRYFLWRVYRNNIPVRNLLRSRGVQTTILYPMCNVDIEHVRHLFLECQYVKTCWGCLESTFDVSGVEVLSTWVLERMGSESEERLMKLVKAMWGIWWARNRRVWENKVVPPLRAIETCSKMISEWQATQEKAQSSVMGGGRLGNRGVIKWQPPLLGWHKANVDAAIQIGASEFKVGMVIRNANGEFVEGLQKSINEEMSVLEAEAVGVYEALCWLMRLGLRKVIVESYSLVIVNALLNNTTFVSEVGTIFENCRSIFRQRSDFKVQHVRRQANKVTHNIARISCMLGTVNYFYSPPPCVLEHILYDYSI
ncbi:hypothetical protein AgCh_010516 [Apium graveolens]